jgi:hypothetical protein
VRPACHTRRTNFPPFSRLCLAAFLLCATLPDQGLREGEIRPDRASAKLVGNDRIAWLVDSPAVPFGHPVSLPYSRGNRRLIR